MSQFLVSLTDAGRVFSEVFLVCTAVEASEIQQVVDKQVLCWNGLKIKLLDSAAGKQETL